MVLFHLKTTVSIDLFEVVNYVISKQENFSRQEITIPCALFLLKLGCYGNTLSKPSSF